MSKTKTVDHEVWLFPVMIIAILLYQNFDLQKKIKIYDHRLAVHLLRIRKENDFQQKLCFNGAQVAAPGRCCLDKYLTNDQYLKDEYILKVDTTLKIIDQIRLEHVREDTLIPVRRALFSHTSLYLDESIMIRSILDNKVYFGTLVDFFLVGKYDYFINQKPVNAYSDKDFEVDCSGTCQLQINVIQLNYKTAELDTTVLKEEYVFD